MSDRDEPFLRRWSRLKREQPEKAEEKPAAPPAKQQQQEAPAPLPPVEQLAPDSDFKPFMDPRVGAETRSEALKKLFGDAHFNAPDLFEPYSGDFAASEPIPLEMLKKLNQARRLLFEETPPAKESLPQEAEDDPGKQDA
ncbi:MAG TPA: DUF3306 domain-containing protein [Burkholderiales bacterium]|nr:DUF3306 domain-containing protein [Burkholderiales bacterium]